VKKKLALQTLLAATLVAGFSGAFAVEKPFRVGVTAGPHAQIVEIAKKVAARDGLTVQIVEFTDFIQPNAALAQEQLDANVYQHVPFLETQNRDRGYKLVVVAPAVRQQMGIYSKKIKNLSELKEGARVGIPNDPTNGSRALLVLRDQGLIKLKDGITTRASVLDITENPKKLRFIELEAAQLPRSLDDLDASAVNSNYAVPAGLSPIKDSLALENPNTPYVTVVIATREGQQNDLALRKFVKAYQSPEVKQFIDVQFKGAYWAAW
jgi:D-methionine transport system substrate-binding protein